MASCVCKRDLVCHTSPLCVSCVCLRELWDFLAHVACCASVSVWAFAPVMNVTEDTDREQLYCSCKLANVSLCV